ncbi:MAG: hypothetical protein ACTSRZ_01945 [Promethearchaeota archaeon]
MSEEVELEVKCPFEECTAKKKIKVPSYVFKSKQFGTVKIQINQGIVCPNHQFVIFVDKKGKIRSYEKIDVQLAIIRKPKEEPMKKLSLNDVIGEIGEFAAFNITHALLLNIPITIYTSKRNSMLEQQITGIFKNLFPNFKESDSIKFLDRSEFKNLKRGQVLALDEKGYILISPWEITKFDFEQSLLNKVLGAKDIKAQSIIFRQIVESLFKKVEFVRELLHNSEVLYEEDIKEKFEEKFLQKKVSDYEIDLIKEILKFRYLEDISKIKIRSFDKLKESLW